MKWGESSLPACEGRGLGEIMLWEEKVSPEAWSPSALGGSSAQLALAGHTAAPPSPTPNWAHSQGCAGLNVKQKHHGGQRQWRLPKGTLTLDDWYPEPSWQRTRRPGESRDFAKATRQKRQSARTPLSPVPQQPPRGRREGRLSQLGGNVTGKRDRLRMQTPLQGAERVPERG